MRFLPPNLDKYEPNLDNKKPKPDTSPMFLYDSAGNYIAVLVNSKLYNSEGKQIGRRIDGQMIFIDNEGYYLGDIFIDRLVFDQSCPYPTTCFGRIDNPDWVEISNDSRQAALSLHGQYIDIPRKRLLLS